MFIWLLISILIFEINAQVEVKSDEFSDELYQQIQRSVQRINLKDFGIDRPSKASPQPKPKSPEYNFVNTNDNPFNTRRDVTSFDRSYPRRSERGNRRLIGVSEASIERSSPIEWTSFENRNGLSRHIDFNPRRAFDFSLNDSVVNPRKRNCSEICVLEKYLQHYREKGCTPIFNYECNCVLSFSCGSSLSKNSSICRYEGQVYEIGSRIVVSNPCRICECRDLGPPTQVVATIDCGIGIECPESAFGIGPEPNCYFAYDWDKCCGHQVCNKSLIPRTQEKVCKYKDRLYKKGQKIYPEEDNCLICLCSDQWNDENPLSSGACHKYQCDLQLDKEFQNGCLPIYHESNCCPIEYKCPRTFSLTTDNSDQINCVFDGRKYPIGSRLETDNICVDCICKIPPDFTCVHKSCPTPPNHDCYVSKWNNTVCCQEYKCPRNRLNSRAKRITKK